MSIEFNTKVEIRTWFVDGKYIGRESPWVEYTEGCINPIAMSIADPMIGSAIKRQVEYCLTCISNRDESSDDWSWAIGRHCSSPINIQDWGQFRVIVNPCLSA